MKYLNRNITILLLFGIILRTVANQQIRIRLGGTGMPIPIMNYFLNQREDERENRLDNNNQEHRKNENNERGNDEDQTVTTNSYVVNTESGPVRITQVHVRRNLNADRERKTPIRIIRNVDSYFDNIFDSFIGNMINMQHMNIINHIRKDQSQREEELKSQEKTTEIQQNQSANDDNEDIDTRLDEDNPSDQEAIKKIEQNDDKQNYTNKQIFNPTNTQAFKMKTSSSSVSSTNKTKVESILNINKMKEYQEKRKKRQKLFVQICKYVFYSIILFSFYIVLKKMFQLLDLIDSCQKPISKLNEANNHMVKIEDKKIEMIKTEKVS